MYTGGNLLSDGRCSVVRAAVRSSTGQVLLVLYPLVFESYFSLLSVSSMYAEWCCPVRALYATSEDQDRRPDSELSFAS
jgi:hypothetical protein